MDELELKEYIGLEDCDVIVAYLMGKAELTYGQAMEVTEMLSRMVNLAATRIAKDMGAIWYGLYGKIFKNVLSILQNWTACSDTL